MTPPLWTITVILFLAADFAFGVKVGRMLKRDEPDDDFAPMPRRLNVPPQQSHAPRSESKDRHVFEPGDGQ